MINYVIILSSVWHSSELRNSITIDENVILYITNLFVSNIIRTTYWTFVSKIWAHKLDIIAMRDVE